MRGIDRANQPRGRRAAGPKNPGITRHRDRPRNRLKPGLLALEDRRLLSTFTVTSTGDATDNSGDPVSGTLRWAAEQAETATSPVTIDFDLGSSPATITLAELLNPVQLDNATEPIDIDGPGSTLLTIDGNNLGPVFEVDSGTQATITGLEIAEASGGGEGAIYDFGALSLENCTIAGSAGSGVNVLGSADLTDCTISDAGQYNGGGVAVEAGAQATIDGCTFNDDTAVNGSAIFNNGTTTVSDCTLTGNSAATSTIYNGGQLDASGCTISGDIGASAGLYNHGGYSYVGNCTFSGDTGSNGSGVSNSYGATLVLKDSTIESFSAPGVGGGLYNGGTVTLTDCTIAGNTAGSWGGGAANGEFHGTASMTITDSMITGNTSMAGSVGLASGGTLDMTDCTISGNSGVNGGGGLANSGAADLTGCTLSANTGEGGGLSSNGGTIDLTGCTISSNTGLNSGGGLDNISGEVDLTDCTLSGNTGANGGGLKNSGMVDLTGCTVFGNLADSSGDGGGVASLGTTTLTACTISGNTATGSGGGIDDDQGNNSLTMTDTIVAGNISTAGGTSSPSDIILGVNGTSASGSNNLVGTGGSGGLTGTDNRVGVADPGLAAPGNYGGPTETIAFLPGSPALGGGAPVQGITTDQRGEPLDSPEPDIGAFQSQGFTLTTASGSTPQSASTGAAFADPLAVLVIARNSVEPVLGGSVTFTAPSTGASATLSSTSTPIGSNGRASVTATANTTGGTYAVDASAAVGETAAQASFSLTNLVVLTFSGLNSPSIIYGTSTTTISGKLANGSMTPMGETVSVKLDGVSETATIGAGGAFSASFDTAALTVAGSPYPIHYAYTSDGIYSAASTTSTLAVTPATVTPVVTVADKVYDGTTSATLSSETLDGVLGTDAVSLSGGTAAFVTRNVGTDETVNVTGLSLAGADAIDYQLSTTTATTTASISPAPLTITAATDSKTYDGTTDASATPTYQVAGLPANTLCAGDSFIELIEAFQSGNALGTGGSTLAVAYVIDDGTLGGNYAVTTQTAAGTIVPAPLTITAATDSRTYDGDTEASATPTVAGLIGTDTGPGRRRRAA
jgi:hypothetical protein